jgi:glycine betaine/proline transport system ATP-binding protein
LIAAANSTAPPLVCRDVWKVFGPDPSTARALAEEGLSRHEIFERCGQVVGVQNVSISVGRGETFVVMGLSGSGKSTLIRCLSRLVEPTFGTVHIDGENICQADPDRLRELRRHKLSMVFQHFGLFPHRRVIDNVAYGLEIQGLSKGVRHERARQVLEVVGLDKWADHFPEELSGGMQQRVGLARAMAVDPEIMFFDEPFSALDPLIRRDMQDELLELQRTMHRTIVFITHDFAEALKMGDHVAIMKDGRIEQVGTPQQVVIDPATDYVREFTKDVPLIKVLTVESVMGARPPGLLADGPSVSVSTRLEEALPLVIGSEHPVPVVDDAGGIVGSLDRASMAAVLRSTR